MRILSLLSASLMLSVYTYGQKNKVYQYDNANQITKESYSPECKFITYTYDLDGNRLIQNEKYFNFISAVQIIDCSHPIGSVSLTPLSTGVFSYVWSTGATGNSLNVSQQGTYTVTITESNFNNVCNQEYFVYADSTQAVANIYGTTTFCENSNTTLIADTGVFYLWSNGATTPSITVNDSGFYSVTVTDSLGCIKQSLPIQINMILEPYVSFGCNCLNYNCKGDTLPLIVASIPNGVYQWFDNGLPITPAQTDTTLLWFSSINVSVQATDTITGCQSQLNGYSQQYYVAELPDSTISLIGNNPFCLGDSTTLQLDFPDTFPQMPYDIFWYQVGSLIPVGFDTIFNPTIPGQYYAVTDNYACQVTSDTITITTLPIDTASFSGLPNTICVSSGPLTLSGSPFGGTFAGDGITDSTFAPSMAGVGFHTIIYSYTNLAGCIDTCTKLIYVDACVGFESLNASQEDFSVSPNPTDKHLKIDFTLNEPQKVFLSLLDDNGRLVKSIFHGSSSSKANSYGVNTEDFKSGIYFVFIIRGERISSQKVVIQR